MKKIILLALTTLIMMGCDFKTEDEVVETCSLKKFNTIVIDSCEYLISTMPYGNQGFGYFAHKGNCRFCKERRQKELEWLINELKGE